MASKPHKLRFSVYPALGFQICAARPSSYMGSEDLHPGSHTFQTEPSLQCPMPFGTLRPQDRVSQQTACSSLSSVGRAGVCVHVMI